MMRRISLGTMAIAGTDQTARYAELIETILYASPRAGLDTNTAMKSHAVAVVVKAAEKSKNPWVYLEEADWALLCLRLDAFAWARFDAACAVFVDAIRNAEKHDMNAAPEPTDGGE